MFSVYFFVFLIFSVSLLDYFFALSFSIALLPPFSFPSFSSLSSNSFSFYFPLAISYLISLIPSLLFPSLLSLLFTLLHSSCSSHPLILSFLPQVKIWFQNHRYKTKKQRADRGGGIGGNGLELTPLPCARRVPIKMLVSDGKPVSQQHPHPQYQHPSNTPYTSPFLDMGGYFQPSHVRTLAQTPVSTHTSYGNAAMISPMTFTNPGFHQTQDYGVGHTLTSSTAPSGNPMHYGQTEDHGLSVSPQFPSSGFGYHSQT